jgi:EAL domain-containing protein (putative c-di-GMP-specific phosphodiesterase class I)
VVRDLARALEIEVVAEGVERAIEAQCLLEEGIPIAQGYLFSRPCPFDDICALLAGTRGVLREVA